jgi:glutathione reductase (NADPH)
MNVDLVVVGSGEAAQGVVFRMRAAGWSVAAVDSRPFGGTCSLRGL